MARKNTLFEVDITKENPLITIVKHGKIPVVEMQQIPFKRHKAVRLFEKDKRWIECCKENGINYVSYCNIGGFHGVHFSHWMIMENINIGYVEPEDIVFDLTSNAIISAKRKLESVKNAWKSLLKKESEEDISYGKWSWFNEHFADFQHVCVDTKAIRTVHTIHRADFKSYVPYIKDGYLGIGCIEDLFTTLWNEELFDKKFLEHIDAPDFYNEWTRICDRDCKDAGYHINYTFNNDFMQHNSHYNRNVLDELLNYYLGKPYSYTRKYFQDYKKAMQDFLNSWKNGLLKIRILEKHIIMDLLIGFSRKITYI